MEMGEIISLPEPHVPEKCPFCPPPKDEDFTTYPGAKASGSTLGDIMKNPADLVSKQEQARPKDGGPERQSKPSSKPRPDPPLAHPTFGPYSYEAHHLIPGKQPLLKKEGGQTVMKGHSIENWIRKGPNIKKDTGYSINNSDNGVWLPSAPESVKKLRGRNPARPWEQEGHPEPHPNALTQAEKEEIADFAMARAGQFHYGQHAVNDDSGSCDSYPGTVEKRLTELDRRLWAWANECPLCGKKPAEPPYDPSWKVNELLTSSPCGFR